jgi:sugar phosphate isomerase/epimerase
MERARRFTLFTKPWPRVPLPDLARFVARLGFDGVELPVRPGFQVEPERALEDLPRAAQVFRDEGLTIAMVACAAAGVPLIRVCLPIDPDGYLATVARLQRRLDALVPILERNGVCLGVQNHSGRYISNAMGLRHLLERYDPRQVAAVWDAAHNALNGEDADLALDIVWSHLRMVNLKNAYWRRTSGPEAVVAEWEPYWTLGRHGLASWPKVAAELHSRGFRGPICLPAEYTDEAAVARLVAEDLEFARTLFQQWS